MACSPTQKVGEHVFFPGEFGNNRLPKNRGHAQLRAIFHPILYGKTFAQNGKIRKSSFIQHSMQQVNFILSLLHFQSLLEAVTDEKPVEDAQNPPHCKVGNRVSIISNLQL